MAAIVEATASNIGMEGSKRFLMHGPSIEVGPQAALSFSLVLHELAKNASKYGALSGEKGVVDVMWSLARDEGVDMLAFDWIESGGPDVRVPDRKGFGSRLIVSSLQGFGNVSVDYRPEGLRVAFKGQLKKLQYKNYTESE